MTTNRGVSRGLGRTAAELDAQRQALEAAGREEWIRATREGRKVEARTPQELRELGARVLARKTGKLDDVFVSGTRGQPVRVTAALAGEDELVRPETQVAFEPTLNERVQNSPGSRIYARIEADWDPAQSNGVTAMPSDGMLDAGERYKGTYKVTTGDEEVGFFAPNPDGSLRFQTPAGKTRTGSSETADYASARPHPDSTAGIHWHRDKGSNGFVDDVSDKRRYGDAQSLVAGMPMATVFKNEVGWHGLENGRLVFVYPTGTMSDDQIREKQRNLNQAQREFYKK